MFLYKNWWLPESEQHMPKMLDKAEKKTGVVEYQKEVRDEALNICKIRNKTNVALDVGSHIGFWTKDLSENFNRVICFEPVQEFRNCFNKNIVDRKNVILFPFALGDKQGSVSMFINPENTGNTHVDLSQVGSVNMISLDNFLDDYPIMESIDFIKIDTEGFEIYVLNGAVKTLKKYQPIVTIEQKPHDYYHNDRYVALNFLNSLGYKILKQVRDDYILGMS